MAITVVNCGTATTSSNGTTLAKSGTAIPAGALIVVGVAEKSSTVGGSVADAVGNTYTALTGTVIQSSLFIRLFYAYNVSALTSGQSITFTRQTANDACLISIMYATGIRTSSDPHDSAAFATNTNGSNNTAATVTSGTPSAAGDLAVGWLGEVSFSSVSSFGGGWNANLTTNTAGSGPAIGGAGATQVNAGSSAITFSATLNTSNRWGAQVALFIAAPTGGGGGGINYFFIPPVLGL